MMCRVNSCALVVVVAVGAGCGPQIDGGWQGNALCGNDSFPVTAVFNGEGDGELEGVVYIENIDVGIFGGNLIVRGNIVGGERDKDDGSYEFDLQTDEDAPPEFTVDISFDDKDPDQLNGDVTVNDNDGQPSSTCDLDLERTSVSGD